MIEEIYDPYHRKYVEAQAFLVQRNVLPGPDGYTAEQLYDEFRLREWSVKLNSPSERAGDVVEASTHHPNSETQRFDLRVVGTTPVVALAIALMQAIEFDNLPLAEQWPGNAKSDQAEEQIA